MNSLESQLCHPIEILLVEDDLADIKLTKRALKNAHLVNNVHVARDGVESLSFLRNEGEFVDAPRPDLVLLDLNMPRMDGRELLQEVKADERLRAFPIIVMSTSESIDDVEKSYMRHANSYITKPLDSNQFTQAIACVTDYWFSVVKLPPKVASCSAGQESQVDLAYGIPTRHPIVLSETAGMGDVGANDGDEHEREDGPAR
jgi:chemotaxis family two-component system response regulator Rcp1